MRLIKDKPNIDFLGRTRRNIAVSISIIAVIVSIASLATRGLDFGIDFTGGILLEASYPNAANLDNIRQSLTAAGFEEVRVQRFGPETDVQVRLPPQPGSEPNEIRETLRGILAGDDFRYFDDLHLRHVSLPMEICDGCRGRADA
jgi:preprotein translocase subunit SecF